MNRIEKAKKAASLIRSLPGYGGPGSDFDVVARKGFVYGKHESIGISPFALARLWKMTASEAWSWAKECQVWLEEA